MKTYMIECHTQPRPVLTFTSNPSEARGFQQAFTEHSTASVFLLTDFGKGGFEKHLISPEVLERHIKILELKQVAADLEEVMKGIEEHLAGQAFDALLLQHTGQTFDAFKGNWSLKETERGLHVEYASRQCPFTLTVTGPDSRMPWTEDDFWVCLNLPEHTYPGFWCVKGVWEEAQNLTLMDVQATLVDS